MLTKIIYIKIKNINKKIIVKVVILVNANRICTGKLFIEKSWKKLFYV